MTNKFYTVFDTGTLGPRAGDPDPYRTPFQRDRDRIVHGQPFRRLQGKTQVFLTGEYDFYRTRLTHSIEVAQIGRSICNVLRKKGEPLKDDYYIDADLVEAACLAHDLGNPPFGHAGERTLHKIMERFGGFEGNAQCLRLITEMFYGTMKDKAGMKPTRAFLDAILKYKVIYDTHKKKSKSKFLYPEQRKYLDFVFEGFNWRAHARHLPTSIECQIMHWADNVAYSIDDLKDATVAGFINSQTIGNWVEGQSNLTAKTKDRLNELRESVKRDTFHPHLSRRMGDFIRAVSLERVRGFMSRQSNRYAFSLKVQDDIEQEYKAYSDLAVAVVFSSAKLQQLEFKADQVLKALFYSLQENYDGKTKLHLVPEDWHNYVATLKTKAERARTICDFIAGMTDSFAGRYFQRFFLPEYGSLTDLV